MHTPADYYYIHPCPTPLEVVARPRTLCSSSKKKINRVSKFSGKSHRATNRDYRRHQFFTTSKATTFYNVRGYDNVSGTRPSCPLGVEHISAGPNYASNTSVMKTTGVGATKQLHISEPLRNFSQQGGHDESFCIEWLGYNARL